MNFFSKTFFLFTLLCIGVSFCKAQTYMVKGKVLDTAGLPLPGAVVRIKWVSDSLAISAASDGSFNFSKVKSPQFTLSAAFIGFEAFSKAFKIPSGKTFTVPDIKLQPTANTLDAVVISGVPPVRVTEDTVSFNASSFPVREDDAVEEILKKLPGIKVDKDGNVTNQGEPVTKIRVNGKDFFGTDVATAIKNLPADIIKNLQFIDDYGDQAKLTGIKTGEPQKILNLTIAEDKKKGYYARASGGMGNADRYNTSVRAHLMKNERQISVDGTVNNANNRGGGGDGLTTRNAAGLNYRNEWNEKLSVDGWYNYEDTKNSTVSKTQTESTLQTIVDNESQKYVRLEIANNDNVNTRYKQEFGGNIEYKADTMNYLKISPEFHYNSNSGNSAGLTNISQLGLFTDRNSRNQNNSRSINAKTNVFYNHKFAKRGRNFSYWGNINYNNGSNFRDVLNDYHITGQDLDSTRLQNQLTDQQNNSFGTYTGFSYMEPIWQKTFIEFNYNFGRTANTNNKETSDVTDGEKVFNENLSNIYDYQFITNKFGLSYRHIDEKYNYNLGFSAQPAVLKGQNLSKDVSTRQNTFNLIPSARFVYHFSRKESLEANYWGRNNQPGFYQLQPITDNSNLQNTVTGNPDLKPEFVQGFNAHYKQSDWDVGHILDARVSYNRTQNKIVTTKMLIPNTVNQVTSYTNTNGFFRLDGNFSYSKPFAERKFTIEYSGWGSLNNNVAFVDNNRNEAKNAQWRQELEFRLDLEDITNLELETSYSENLTTYSLSGFEDRKTNRFQYGIEGRNYFFEDLTIGYDFSKTINTGFDNSIVNNPTLLRLFLEYKFLKQHMGTLRLDGFDLFNQNSGISRDVFDNVIVDRQVNRLGRFFMLSFIFRVRNFGG